jgi:hypothetical protein
MVAWARFVLEGSQTPGHQKINGASARRARAGFGRQSGDLNSDVVVMVMMVVVMMVRPVCQGRTCERHQQQSCRKYFLHGSNPSMVSIACKRMSAAHVSKEQRSGWRGAGACEHR